MELELRSVEICGWRRTREPASSHDFKIKMMYLMLDLLFCSRLDKAALGERGAQLVSLKLTLGATRSS